MPRILIELSDDEYRVLLAAAKRDRRTAQAQAAQLLVGILREWAEKGMLAEAQGHARAAAAGSLPSQQQIGAVEGHRDGAGGAINEVVVGGPGEAQ